MDSIISTELNSDTLHMATDSSTINSMNCPADDMSVLAANDELLGYTSNVENIPELTDVTVAEPPSSRKDVNTSGDISATEKINIINIEPTMSDLHVATDEQQDILPEARQRLETMSGLCELSLERIINVAQDVLSTLESDITQIDRLASPSTLGPMVFPEPEVSTSDINSKDTSNVDPLESTDIYYDILTPSGDDMIYLSHRSIVQNKCIVKARLLLDKDIAEIQTQLKEHSVQTTTANKRKISLISYQGMDTTKQDVSSDELVVKRSHRPRHTPSRLRIKAQEIISGNRIKPKLPAPSLKSSIKTTSANASPTDSDDTIIYQLSDNETWMKSDDESLVYSYKNSMLGKLKMTFFGLMKKHGKCVYKCVMCDTYCKSVSSFHIYYRTSHPPVKCKRCHKEFSTPNSLKHHMYEHKIKSHKCNNCGKLFSFESQLKDNLKSHRKLKPYPCPWVKNGKRCPKDFNYKGDLNRHLRMHTEPELCC